MDNYRYLVHFGITSTSKSVYYNIHDVHWIVDHFDRECNPKILSIPNIKKECGIPDLPFS